MSSSIGVLIDKLNLAKSREAYGIPVTIKSISTESV